MHLETLLISEIPTIKYSVAKNDLEVYGTDWTNYYKPNPTLVVFPTTTKEVQSIVKFANKHKISVVPSGGRTGLSGGAVAKNEEIVICMNNMSKILDFNEVNATVCVEAGVITEEIQNFAASKGLFYPVDFASRGSSQIGGNIATNAGGIRVLRYGLTRDWVLGLEFVTPTGEIINTNKGLLKNATGYDLRHLLIGSEGSLGVITQATIKLTKIPENIQVLFFGISDISNVNRILTSFKKQLTISAFEFISDLGLRYSAASAEIPHPFSESYPYYILIEFENSSIAINEKVERIVTQLYEEDIISDDILGVNSSEIERIWCYRERIAEAVSPYINYKNDISVLTSLIPKFIYQADRLLKKSFPDFEVIWCGHIADGNLHTVIIKPENLTKEEFYAACNKINSILYELIGKFEGSISAEHGLGLLKKDYLHYSKSKAEIALMKSIKKVFDPNNIMNTGKVIEIVNS